MSKLKLFYSLIKQNIEYKKIKNVPIFTKLNDYQENEARAWEDEWKKNINKSFLDAYKLNMRVFEKLKFWEESGEAARFIPTDSKMTVLDIGCGNGLSTANIKGNIVVGIDLSVTQMVRAKMKWSDKYFAVADAQNLPFRNESFDYVVAINLLHHISNQNRVLDEFYRVLKKGGTLLTVDPNLTNPIGFIGRGAYKIFNLKKIFPTFPQFALGEDERQFTKGQYYDLYKNSLFKNYKIIPHRIERLFFFMSILIPILSKVPFYESLLIFVSKIGNKVVKISPFDYLCYFWIGEAKK